MTRSASEPPEAVVRGGLTRARILDEAVAFIDEQSVAALSMRKLGHRLGVEAMSLYRYVEGREDLLDGIVQQITRRLEEDPELRLAEGDGWQHYLQRLAHAVREVALAHPKAFPLVATRHPAAPWLRPPLRSLAVVEAFLDALKSRGFSDEAAVQAYRAFSSFLLGHLLLEASSRGGVTAPAEEPLAEATAENDDDTGEHAQGPRRETSLEEFPQLQRLQDALSDDHSYTEFVDSLENLLQRLELTMA